MKHFHSQNLNDSKKFGGIIRFGRAWWGPFSWEWSILNGVNVRISFSKRGFNFATGFFSFYFNWRDNDYDSNNFTLYWYDWAIWLGIWISPMESNRTDPWWKQMHVFHIDDFILGRRQCTHEVGEKQEVLIPMPEGCYMSIASFEKRTWKRPRWFAFSRESTDILIPGGIPHSGKGENSWDCGDDGLWGIGCDGHDIPKAIATTIESVLKSRKWYGNTSTVNTQLSSIVPLNLETFKKEHDANKA